MYIIFCFSYCNILWPSIRADEAYGPHCLPEFGRGLTIYRYLIWRCRNWMGILKILHRINVLCPEWRINKQSTYILWNLIQATGLEILFAQNISDNPTKALWLSQSRKIQFFTGTRKHDGNLNSNHCPNFIKSTKNHCNSWIQRGRVARVFILSDFESTSQSNNLLIAIYCRSKKACFQGRSHNCLCCITECNMSIDSRWLWADHTKFVQRGVK